VCPIGGDGRPGAPITPLAYRKAADGSYAPLDGHGRQIAPLQSGIPFGDNGLHTDPATGLLTPKNADGDYYTLGPDGTPSYFDRNGAPISADRFHTGAPGADPPPPAAVLATCRQSGDAVVAQRVLGEPGRLRAAAAVTAAGHSIEAGSKISLVREHAERVSY
jgi:hypothetical protein